MKVIYNKETLSNSLLGLRNEGKRIGLVPTMGALHEGHLSLINHLKAYCDIVVCSIFVNPTQFNDLEDLKKYPRTLEQDLILLEKLNCDIVFVPSVEEMYSQDEEWSIDLGRLDRILEGEQRPGHYQGVTQIVKKLFDIAQPHVACFGQKDFQQFLVIKKMVEIYNLNIDLIMSPTLREEDGLALSSRNVRLSPRGRKLALAIYQSLLSFQEKYLSIGIQDARKESIEQLHKSEGVELEYFEVCNAHTLEVIQSEATNGSIVVLAAAWVEGVRLIDNAIL